MFKPDNPLMIFLSKLADIMILNLLFIICSLPIITIGASITAMYYVAVKLVKNEESYIWKDFFKSFKLNFKQATIIWMINLIVLVVLFGDIYIMMTGSIEGVPSIAYIATVLVAIVVMAAMVFVYPMLSHFSNTIVNTFKNSLLLAVANLPYTVVFIVVTLAPFAIVFSTPWGMKVSPLLLLLGFSGPAYLCSTIWRMIFSKLDPTTKDQGEENVEEEG